MFGGKFGLEEDEGDCWSRFAIRRGVMAFDFEDHPEEDSLRILSFILSERGLKGVAGGAMVVKRSYEEVMCEGEGDEATWDEETPESTDEESTKVWIGSSSTDVTPRRLM